MTPPKGNARRARPGTGYIEAYSKFYAPHPAPLPTQDQYPVTLSGSRCKCTACGLYFSSDYAFQKHRVGRYMPMERRCLTKTEMLAKGMCLVGNFWVSKRRAAQTIPANAISSKTGTHSSLVTEKAIPSLGVGSITGKTHLRRGGVE